MGHIILNPIKSNTIYIYIFQVAKKKANQDLLQWIPDIRNHFWHCSKTCNGDEETLKVIKVSSFIVFLQYLTFELEKMLISKLS